MRGGAGELYSVLIVVSLPWNGFIVTEYACRNSIHRSLHSVPFCFIFS